MAKTEVLNCIFEGKVLEQSRFSPENCDSAKSDDSTISHGKQEKLYWAPDKKPGYALPSHFRSASLNSDLHVSCLRDRSLVLSGDHCSGKSCQLDSSGSWGQG